MSERFECALLTGLRGEVIGAFHDLHSPLPIGLGELDRDLFAVYVRGGRLFNPPEVEKIAVSLSMRFGKALLLLYDNSCGVRFAALYESGALVKEFDERDEIWVPLDEQGYPDTDRGRFRWDDIKDDSGGEYDCIYDAIDAGLDALGVRDRLDRVSLKQKVVHEFDYQKVRDSETFSPRSHAPRYALPITSGAGL